MIYPQKFLISTIFHRTSPKFTTKNTGKNDDFFQNSSVGKISILAQGKKSRFHEKMKSKMKKVFQTNLVGKQVIIKLSLWNSTLKTLTMRPYAGHHCQFCPIRILKLAPKSTNAPMNTIIYQDQ